MSFNPTSQPLIDVHNLNIRFPILRASAPEVIIEGDVRFNIDSRAVHITHLLEAQPPIFIRAF